MIVKKVTVAYMVGDKPCASFEDAQKEELRILLSESQDQTSSGFADHLLGNKAKFVDVLTSTPRSRAKARAINGAKRKRKSLPKLITASETGA
jgi:hypothetical protein